MNKPKIIIVAAVGAKTRVLGRGNGLVFRISDDLKRFKRLTRGHPIIWGRKTYESIGRPLPERTNIIITRNPDLLKSNLKSAERFALGKTEGVIIVPSLEEAVQKASALDKEQITIGGGGDVYKQALPFVDKLYLTLVESDAEGDVFFPDWRKEFTKETFREERCDEKTGLKYAWVDLDRE